MTEQLIVLDPAYSPGNRSGHYARYLDTLLLGLPEDWRCTILGLNHENFHSFLASEGYKKQFTPCYSRDLWGKHANDSSNLTTPELNQIFFEESDLELAKFRAHSSVKIFVPNTTPFNILGLFDLAFRYPQYSFIAMLRYQRSLFEYHAGIKIRELAQTNNFAVNLEFVTDSDGLSIEFQSLFPTKKIINIDIPNLPKMGDHAESKNFIVSTFGNARGEKGIDLAIEVAFNLRSTSLDSRLIFDLQLNSPSSDVAEIVDQVLKNPQTNIIPLIQELSDADYDSRLQKSNIILLPYKASIYGNRTSGVLREAQLAAIPVVVCESTWLADEVNSRGGGIIAEFTVEGIQRAILEIQSNYDQFKLEALVGRAELEHLCDPQTVFLKLRNIWAGIKKKDVLIFFPWGFSDASASGAGYRLNQIRNLLEKNAITTHLIISGFWDSQKILDFQTRTYQLPFNLSKSENLHTSLFKGSFTQESKEFIEKLGDNTTEYFFPTTHLVSHVVEVFGIDKDRVIIESQDLLSESSVSGNELTDLEISALEKGKAFSLSATETEEFKQFVDITYSNMNAYPQISLKDDQSELLISMNVEQLVGEIFVFFPGSAHPPNKEAAEFLIKVSRMSSVQNLKFVFCGQVLPAYQEANVISLGVIPELLLIALMRRALFVVNPMFRGTGIPIKVLESLGYGAYVYSTPIGARGVQVHNYERLVVEKWDSNEWPEYANSLAELISRRKQIQTIGSDNHLKDLKKDQLISELEMRLDFVYHRENRGLGLIAVLEAFGRCKISAGEMKKILCTFDLYEEKISSEQRKVLCLFLLKQNLTGPRSIPYLLILDEPKKFLNTLNEISWKQLRVPFNYERLVRMFDQFASTRWNNFFSVQEIQEAFRGAASEPEAFRGAASERVLDLSLDQYSYLLPSELKNSSGDIKFRNFVTVFRQKYYRIRMIRLMHSKVIQSEKRRRYYDRIANITLRPRWFFSWLYKIVS